MKEFVLNDIRNAFPIRLVTRRPGGAWMIEVVTSISSSNGRVREKLGYFHISRTGKIESAPWGYGKEWKPGRVVDINLMGSLAAIGGGS